MKIVLVILAAILIVDLSSIRLSGETTRREEKYREED